MVHAVRGGIVGSRYSGERSIGLSIEVTNEVAHEALAQVLTPRLRIARPLWGGGVNYEMKPARCQGRHIAGGSWFTGRMVARNSGPRSALPLREIMGVMRGPLALVGTQGHVAVRSGFHLTLLELGAERKHPTRLTRTCTLTEQEALWQHRDSSRRIPSICCSAYSLSQGQ